MKDLTGPLQNKLRVVNETKRLEQIRELISEENYTLPELLEEVKGLVEAWDDPSQECPPFQLCRMTPDQRTVYEAQSKKMLAFNKALCGEIDS